MARRKDKKNSNGGNLGFEEKLWQAADKMRGHMDPAEYKHVVLGLIFLKYISDAFEERHKQLEIFTAESSSEYYVAEEQARYGVVEDRDEYLSENIFFVPKEARWSYLQSNAKQSKIGKLVDDAMLAIEKEPGNQTLKGVLPKDYARPTLDKHTLGELIDLIGTIGLGDAESRSKDVLGRVYEYFLGRFASAEGKGGGEFYTPQSGVKLLVEMIEPYKGRVYDPCCGSGGMFVQSEKFVEAHGGKRGDISIYGQESNPTTWRLCKMNLALRGIEGNIGPHHADSFTNDIHRDLKADFILANPPFNVKEWKGELLRDDVRWKHGVPPVGNANFAWVQHMIHHLAPNGIAGFVLANGSMSSNTSGEGEIRKNIIEADLVDCMIALPGQLFYTTQIPACLWFITRSKKNNKSRDRRGQTLFIDARNMSCLIDRTHRELSDDEINRIAKTYYAWRGEKKAGKYKDISGFCKSTALDEIRSHGYVLTPSRYVGAEELDNDYEPVGEKMSRLAAQLRQQKAASYKLDSIIEDNLIRLGFYNDSKISFKDGFCTVPPETNKIELNRQMNTTLEKMAKVLFKSWFVDFDPVRAKAEGGDIGLPKLIADLFPDSFEDSELGEIPKGWRVGKYDEVLTPSSARIGGEDAMEYSATVGGLSLRGQRFNKQLSKSRTKNKKIFKDDLVFGLSRKVLNFGLMKDDIGSVSPVYEVFKVNTCVYVPELLEMYIRHNMMMHLDILKPGAREGQPIDRNYFLSKKLLIPDLKVQMLFMGLFSNVESHRQNIEELAAPHDMSITKIAAGELSGKDAKRSVK